MRFPLTLALLLVAAPAAAQQPPTASVLRVAPPAKLIAGKKPAALLPNKVIAAGNRIATGVAGRASLQIGGGVLTLGGDSELYLHSTAAGESAAIARLALSHGALRVQIARDQSQAPLDLRLNVGQLRLRALGADLWAAAEPRGETICLIAGTTEIAAEFGAEILDRPGDCLFFSAQNRRLVLKPDGAETLARKLERTAFAADVAMGLPAAAVPTGPRTEAGPGEIAAPAPVAIQSVETPPESTFEIVSAPPPPPLPEPEPEPRVPALAVVVVPPATAEPAVVAAAPPEPAAVRPEPPAPPPAVDALLADGWLVVLASPRNSAAAAAHALKLRAAGIAAAVRSGGGKHRVVVGPYASRDEASTVRAQLQYQLKVNDIWLLQD